jgi:hypothetical protein
MYLLFMALATALSWIAWALVLYTMNPYEVGVGGFILFYVTLLFGLIGTLTLAGMGYRILLLRRSVMVTREVRISFRHAVFLSAVAVAALVLSAEGWLNVWVFVVSILVMSVLEYLFLLREEARRS